jgi:hypothetical protein
MDNVQNCDCYNPFFVLNYQKHTFFLCLWGKLSALFPFEITYEVYDHALFSLGKGVSWKFLMHDVCLAHVSCVSESFGLPHTVEYTDKLLLFKEHGILTFLCDNCQILSS